MKLCLNIGYSGPKMAVPMERILRAEALGFDTVWTSEAYGSDAITPLAYIGALTKRIRVGTNIAQLAARTPANLAMSAQTIDAMIGRGRMILGIGVSGPQIVEGWYGQPWGKPNARLRDYLEITRKMAAMGIRGGMAAFVQTLDVWANRMDIKEGWGPIESRDTPGNPHYPAI